MSLASFFRTDPSWVSFVQRVVLGVVMFPHGAQKLLGWFGGQGFGGTMGYFTGPAGIPAPLAFLVIMAESIGSLMLILGLGARLAAAGIFLVMAGAVVTVHAQHGFFMNWSGTQQGEGFEYHLLAMVLAGSLVAVGAGRLSVDAWIAERLGARRASRGPGQPLGARPAHRPA